MTTASGEGIKDVAILERIVRRDVDAFALLYDRYGGMAFTLAYRMVCERQLAEEIVYEAFLSVWRRTETYTTTHGTVRIWLVTLVHHRAINLLRAQDAGSDAAANIVTLPTPIRGEKATLERKRERPTRLPLRRRHEIESSG